MDSKPFTEPGTRPPAPVKIVIAGGFGVGKTTAVSSISEIKPLTTEAAITSVAAATDSTGHVPSKTTTTLGKGDRLVVETAGGGGYGDPRRRPAALVAADISNGKVGLDAARAIYDPTASLK